MRNIIYFDASDATKFDFERFEKSLSKYAKVAKEDIESALKTLDNFENLHVSRLVGQRRRKNTLTIIASILEANLNVCVGSRVIWLAH